MDEDPSSARKMPKPTTRPAGTVTKWYWLLCLSVAVMVVMFMVISSVMKYLPPFWPLVFLGGGLLFLQSAAAFVYSAVKIVRHRLRKESPAELALPLLLKGKFRGLWDLRAVLLIMLAITVFACLSMMFSPALDDLCTNYLLMDPYAFILALALVPFLFYCVAALNRGRTFLLISMEGLQISASTAERSIPWSEIRGFRLGPTDLVAVVLDKGEFAFPERFGLDPIELRDLLRHMRVACVGDIGSEE